MNWPEYILQTDNPIRLADLRMMDLPRFQKLVLRGVRRLGYSVWLSGKFPLEAYSPLVREKAGYSILLKNKEHCLIQCNQEKGLVDTSLIHDFDQALKKEGIESGFFVTTGIITLSDKTRFFDRPIEFIDAKKILPFLKTIFGEFGLKKEIKQILERRKFSRFDTQRLGKEILWQVDTLHGASLQVNPIRNNSAGQDVPSAARISNGVKGKITDISRGGIGLEMAEEIPSASLLRLKLSFPDGGETIKVISKVVWQTPLDNKPQKITDIQGSRPYLTGQEPKRSFLGYSLGLSFFLVSDKNKEQISNFLQSRIYPSAQGSLESGFPVSDSTLLQKEGDAASPVETLNGGSQEFLLRLLVEKNIIGTAVSGPIRSLISDEVGLDSRINRKIGRVEKMDFKKAEASTRRFFKKHFSKKCKVLEIHRVQTGWESLAKKIDDWYEKRGYRNVYEKSIYIVKLDDKFKVVSYSQTSNNHASKKSNLKATQPVGAGEVREIVKEIVKGASAGSENNSVEGLTQEAGKASSLSEINADLVKKIAVEVAVQIEKTRKSQDLQKKEDEAIKIRETYVSPLEKVKLERNFERIGKVKKAKKGIKSQVKSLRGIKRTKSLK